MRRSIVPALMICLWLVPLCWGDGTEATSFDQALETARDYPIQWNQPGDFERCVALFDQVIAAYPEHPRLMEAKFEMFRVLAMSDRDEHLERANDIINEVVPKTNAATQLGLSARLRMVAFQVDKARHHSFEDLPMARRALGELEAVWERKSVERANIVRYQAMLLNREGRSEQALAALIDYYRETYTWPDEFWAQMKKNTPDQYRAFRQAFMYLNNQVVRAIGSCKGPEASRLLRAAPLGFISHPRVAAAWKRYEEKYILGDGETFETVRKRVYEDAISRFRLENAGSQPVTGQPGGASQYSGTTSRPTETTDNAEQMIKEVVVNRTNRMAIWWLGGIVLLVSSVVIAVRIIGRRAKTGPCPDSGE